MLLGIFLCCLLCLSVRHIGVVFVLVLLCVLLRIGQVLFPILLRILLRILLSFLLGVFLSVVLRILSRVLFQLRLGIGFSVLLSVVLGVFLGIGFSHILDHGILGERRCLMECWQRSGGRGGIDGKTAHKADDAHNDEAEGDPSILDPVLFCL